MKRHLIYVKAVNLKNSFANISALFTQFLIYSVALVRPEVVFAYIIGFTSHALESVYALRSLPETDFVCSFEDFLSLITFP